MLTCGVGGLSVQAACYRMLSESLRARSGFGLGARCNFSCNVARDCFGLKDYRLKPQLLTEEARFFQQFQLVSSKWTDCDAAGLAPPKTTTDGGNAKVL